ncbi:hypothetical protein BBO99_00005470 [Phytophthora kernoviae]|uniref:Peptidyl-prolyl cis-trans isomerase C n=2 Tax=Phytophthora kernoviae TaxID=325452 RepID=A0A3R7KIW7_9STRA|nr:hypothetical protein G195_004823 [Phytophthora kernoviae 00238/432]KAG2523315.1 hypothetical protein JM16_004009 [Phytophthora kernoviae]KAG2525140.1 hypothetical protein JM18_003578 [Phytophthora kernoviae]RLN37990.1 hypothetical protein BBI17_002294 [Phytophthora kernoviae]RLN79151.1 hypothetical protein BBO99_00005470 [Phytophthora kernoviae]
MFPYEFTSTSLPAISRYIKTKATIYGHTTVTQPLFRSYYGGCRVRVVNTTGVYVEDTCTLLDHWKAYGLMLQSPDDLPVCSTGDVCVRNQYNSEWEYTNDLRATDHTRLDQIISVFRSRYADTVALSVLPGVVVAQILLMGIISFYQVMSHQRSVLLSQIWAYRCQNGRMQPFYLAQITYHLSFNSNMYYLGLSTGTLSSASIVNLTLSFFAFSYSLVNLIKARSGEQVLDRDFRLPWEVILLSASVCVAAVLSSYKLTSLAFIGDKNGELLPAEMVPKILALLVTVLLVFTTVASGEESTQNAPVDIKAHASHILVETEQQADDLNAQLAEASNLFLTFAQLAKEHSKCPSSRKGGDLGTFSRGQMVPEFDKVAFEGEVGVVHKVQTQFGWHLMLISRRLNGTEEPDQYRGLKEMLMKVMPFLGPIILIFIMAMGARGTRSGPRAHAFHILVKTEAEADKLFKEIDAADDKKQKLKELAGAHSTCPSGKKGGDLGMFGRGEMVPAFDKVVFEEEVGKLTKVHTQFGWHVLLCTERLGDKKKE